MPARSDLKGVSGNGVSEESAAYDVGMKIDRASGVCVWLLAPGIRRCGICPKACSKDQGAEEASEDIVGAANHDVCVGVSSESNHNMDILTL